MFEATIDGRVARFEEGTTILDAARTNGVEIPSLCHDPRLKPCGSCRLCLVEVLGIDRPVTSCLTPLAAGMTVRTSSPALEHYRRTMLQLLAASYPAEAAANEPDRPFHRWLQHYGIIPAGTSPARNAADSHPYLRVDMSRCIHCYRCMRICDEVQGQSVWHVHNRGSEIRIVAGVDVPLGLSHCVSCGACADTCPTGAISDRQSPPSNVPLSSVRTTCPYCGVGCEMDAIVSGGRLCSVKPALDGPAAKGHLCVKGRYAFEYVYAPERILHPMIRTGGDWHAVSWQDATGVAAERLKRIRERHGPDAIGILGSARATNEENYVAQKFARVVIGTNNVDCCARVCHAPTAAAMSAMLGTGAATNSYGDIERAGTILVYGANPMENHPVVGARIKQAALRGTPLIVVDPRRTELSECAALHLRIRPGTDVALLNAMANVIVSEGLADNEFLDARAGGWDEFQPFIREWPPERAASVCGITAPEIRAAARLYAEGKPAMSFHGLGLTEHMQGTEGVMCLVNLALLTGNLGKPGAGVNPLRGQNNVQGAAHMGCEPEHLTGYQTLAAGRALFERVWQTPLPTAPGKNLLEMLDAAGGGRLHALWTIGYDILQTNANSWHTLRALSAIDFVIVQDMFLNETAHAAGSVFFPAASSYEKDGTFMNAERRVQPVRAAIAVRGESRPDWAIVCAVAAAMGHPAGFEFNSAEEIWNEIRSLWPAGAGITYRRLEHGGLQWPCPDENHPGTPLLHAGRFSAGPRATLRRIEWHPSPETVNAAFPLRLITGRALFQFNCGTMTSRTRNIYWRDTDTLDISAADAARHGLSNGQTVRVVSRYGSAELPVRVTGTVAPGELFATFHSPLVFLNAVTGPHRDGITLTPEYKITAVRLERV